MNNLPNLHTYIKFMLHWDILCNDVMSCVDQNEVMILKSLQKLDIEDKKLGL